jgi:hypothetical protein
VVPAGEVTLEIEPNSQTVALLKGRRAVLNTSRPMVK